VKAVIDTNVLVAGLLNPSGSPARVLDLVALGDLIPVFDDRILAEYRSVLPRPRFALQAAEIEAAMNLLEAAGQNITAPPLALKLPDPDDAPFIEVAVAASCDFLITGNLKHFPAKALGPAAKRIHVIGPGEFIAQQT